LTALVGPNGSGKSSFLRALGLFYDVSAKYTEEDFYAGDTGQDIMITITFSDLTGEESKLFQKYIEGGELTVEKVLTWPSGRASQKYYGTSLQNPDFNAFRLASSAKERKDAYEALRALGKYVTLPKWTKQDDAIETLKNWEVSNSEQCSRQRDDGQFFGFREVGEAHLERHTKFLFVPAVRDASEDVSEGRGSPITELMDLVVRSALAQREDIQKLQEDTRKRYDEIVDPSQLVELRALADAMTDTLKTYVPDASVNLDWLPTDGFEIPLPRAEVKLVENGYASTVGHTGHGLQRAFILTILQHLAVAQAPRLDNVEEQQPEASVMSQTESEDVKRHRGLKMPNLILGIEEPELYQHPNRQRHLAKILFKLAMGSIKGVAEKTQVIYSTHSPLLVDIERFHHIRVLRKEPGEGGKPKQTKVVWTTLDEVVRVIERADGKPRGAYSGATLQPRLQTLMTPWMNEGFFADVAVLVEGEEDRAAILGMAGAMEPSCDLESMGISVIPCMGKNNLDKATAIFRNLQIPTYTIWDSDWGHGKKNEKEEKERNQCLLRLFDHLTEDWPETVASKFACFRKDLKSTLCNEIGQDCYDKSIEACCTRLRLDEDHAVKNPMVIKEIIVEARKQNKRSKMLEEIITLIIALRKGE
jgi:predicted ATPase